MKHTYSILLFFTFLLSISITQTSCKKTVEGCMDKNSANYNPDATIDDGSCDVKGCTSEYSDNYDPEATVDDGSCIPWSDKFVGDYEVTLDCSLLSVLNTPFIMTITASGDNSVLFTLKTAALGTIPISGIVNNDELTFNEFAVNDLDFALGPITINGLIINGDALYGSDKNLTGNIIITLKTIIGNQQDPCPFVGIRQ